MYSVLMDYVQHSSRGVLAVGSQSRPTFWACSDVKDYHIWLVDRRLKYSLRSFIASVPAPKMRLLNRSHWKICWVFLTKLALHCVVNGYCVCFDRGTFVETFYGLWNYELLY